MNKFIFSLIALAALSPSGYAKRAFTIQDAYRTIGVGSLSLSADGKTLSFNVTTQDLKNHSSSTTIHLMPLSPKGTPTSSPMMDDKCSNAQWSADGKWIYYDATGTITDADGKEVKLPQVWRRHIASGKT